MTVHSKKIKIRELEKISGTPRSTIHYYVNCGLLHQPVKTGQTMSYYDTSHVKQLKDIQQIKTQYLKTSKTNRIPIDYIKKQLAAQHSFTDTAPPLKPGDENRPAFSKKQEKINKIIETTLKLYANRGYALTNIRDVAQACGISTPTFYRYFKNKRELFIKTTEYVVKRFKDKIKKELRGEKNLARRSTIMFNIFHDHYSDIGEILSQLRSGSIIGDPWAKSCLSNLYREMMADLVSELETAVEKGIVRPVNLRLLAYFNLAIDELAFHLTTMDETVDIEEVMLFIGDMLNRAFLTGNAPPVFYKSVSVDRS